MDMSVHLFLNFILNLPGYTTRNLMLPFTYLNVIWCEWKRMQSTN